MKTLLTILNKNITNHNVFFVFPTEIAATKWADKLLEQSGFGTVAMERFLAWDTFKSESVRSTRQNKQSIPSVVRKMFAYDIISKNATSILEGEEGFFSYLINPEFANNATSFADWISSLLPQLESWKVKSINKRELSNLEKENEIDSVEKDLLCLYNEYKKFLDNNNLFDPAWEKPPFDDKGKKFIIFYPECLSDFTEYKELLESCNSIELYSCKQLSDDSTINKISAIEYENSRAELRDIALYIRSLNEEHSIPYEEIVINVPDADVYLPYIKRELELYEIPCKSFIGEPLTSQGAGSLFSQVKACFDSSFSFNSIRELLLNNQLPWKSPEVNLSVVEFGIKNNCICSYEDNGISIDVWNKSFATTSNSYEREKTFYEFLKRDINSLCQSTSFQEIQNRYFAFKKDFFDQSLFTDDSNGIIGRCISELISLIEIEKSFPNLHIPNYFAFFVQVLNDKIYLKKQDASGVSIYPYKVAAAAPYLCHLIPDSSQKSISVSYSPFSFLQKDKREELGITDIDVSEVYINMYKQNSSSIEDKTKKDESNFLTRFSCSKKSFNGFTIPQSSLLIIKRTELPNNLYSVEDFNSEEKSWLSSYSENFPNKITEMSKESFLLWALQNSYEKECEENKAGEEGEENNANNSNNSNNAGIDSFINIISDEIKNVCLKENKIRISTTAMAEFYFCPKSWLLKRIIGIKETDLEAQLTSNLNMGILYHSILELFFSEIKKTKKTIQLFSATNGEYDIFLQNAIESVINSSKESFLTKELLKTIKSGLYGNLVSCLEKFTTQFCDFYVAATEKYYEYGPEESNWLFEGKIDLVLVDSDENAFIIDFKTGKSPSFKECVADNNNELTNFQFAMYTELWEKNNFNHKLSGCGFYSINMSKFTGVYGISGGKQKPLSREEFEKTLSVFEKKASAYINAIAKSNIYDVVDVPIDNCYTCPYRTVCRKTFTISGNNEKNSRVQK